MSFLKRIFGKQSVKPDTGAMPKRSLNLQFEPIPQNGERFAEQFVNAVKKNENKELNYSFDTLEFVDNFLQRFSDDGLTVNDFAETIFVAGAYVGQVMVNSNNGMWIDQKEVSDLPQNISMMPIVIKLPNNNIADPIAKAFKRFHYGTTDSITYFYQVMTE
ncbi:hypothetical protein [Mucilaginibacter pocheonensis]|uniref:Uncharacterized protein n=1 Tax=Mucilaginibacter pocheonensis TaxID=398050 RepID=A0ABU1T9K3_9SPHI|nr:hypothetical protein [Mucilaginibacter pocheonensis]MDR6941551.1 hypothetical protein [Mucilaginibacter pocheonensis]